MAKRIECHIINDNYTVESLARTAFLPTRSDKKDKVPLHSDTIHCIGKGKFMTSSP